MTRSDGKAPPFDAELAEVLASLKGMPPSTMTKEMIPALRSRPAIPLADIIGERPITHVDRTIPGPAGEPDLTVAVFQREDHKPGGPGIYFIHGGGMIMGDRLAGIGRIIDWVDQLDAVAVSVDYRLAPEHPDPAPINDCYAGLLWIAAHADELLFDKDKLVISGASAGGGLAAGVSLRVRDEGGPALAGQVLIYPAVAPPNASFPSRAEFSGPMLRFSGFEKVWAMYSGGRDLDRDPYAAPLVAKDLGDLPPALVVLGGCDVLRDEGRQYGLALRDAGVKVDEACFAGQPHGFMNLGFPAAELAHQRIGEWLRTLVA
jgi:acetyl esterase/lipase